jgi:hypothetical protein
VEYLKFHADAREAVTIYTIIITQPLLFEGSAVPAFQFLPMEATVYRNEQDFVAKNPRFNGEFPIRRLSPPGGKYFPSPHHTHNRVFQIWNQPHLKTLIWPEEESLGFQQVYVHFQKLDDVFHPRNSTILFPFLSILAAIGRSRAFA